MTFNATVRSGLSFVRAEVGLSHSEAVLDAGVEIAVARLIDEDQGKPMVARWAILIRLKFVGHHLRIRIKDDQTALSI